MSAGSAGGAAHSRPRSGSGSIHASNHAAQTWSTIAGFLFGALRLNALLIVGAAPLFLLCVLAADPLGAPPALVLALYLAMPIITAAFSAFRDAPFFRIGADAQQGLSESSWWSRAGEHSLLGPTVRILRATALKVWAATALPMALTLVLVVDAQWALAQSWGLAVAPAVLIAAALALMTAFGVAVLVSEQADAPWHVLARVAAFAALRSWPFTLLSLVTLGVGLVGLIWQPILCWALASSLLLYIVWANTRWSLTPALRAAEARQG